MDGSNELVTLGRSECLALLRAGVIGRVVFTDAALPSAQPVNYLLDDEEIIFRTANGSKLAAATRNAVVAFEVDDIDRGTRTGWSVLGVGEAYEVVDPARLAELAERQSDPWAPGRTAHTISIPLQILSGRQLVARNGRGPDSPSPGNEHKPVGRDRDDREDAGRRHSGADRRAQGQA